MINENIAAISSLEAIVSKVLSIRMQSPSYRVQYDVLGDKNVVIDTAAVAVCYASLPRIAQKHLSKIKEIVTCVEPSNCISTEEAEYWLDACIASGAIVCENSSGKDILDNRLKISLKDERSTYCRVYISLTNYRFIRECPQLVKMVVNLMRDGGVPFWNALVFAHGNAHVALGHSYLNFNNSSYGNNKDKHNLYYPSYLNRYCNGKIKPKTSHILSGASSVFVIASHMHCPHSFNDKGALKMIEPRTCSALNADSFEEFKYKLNSWSDVVPTEKIEADIPAIVVKVCGARTKSGRPCKRRPSIGNARCCAHFGKKKLEIKIDKGWLV